MRINHNIAALNTYRQLSANSAQTNKALEKLSSGLRINKAGDDAAGLAISEKMRAQIRGLDQAARNSQDAISLIQTAEGALNETHSILQRMRELATQAANDTNVEVDREEIQKEINQLTSEINRIGKTTEFNTRKLLDGTISAEFGIVEASAFVAGGSTLSSLNLDKKSSLEAGNYSINIEQVDTKTVTGPTAPQIAERTAIGLDDNVDGRGIQIATDSTLADGDYKINVGETTVKTVSANGSGSTIDNHISGTPTVQAFSGLDGDYDFVVNRTVGTDTFAAGGTGITGVKYNGTGSLATATGYSVEVGKTTANLADNTAGGVRLNSITVADNSTVEAGVDYQVLFQERAVATAASGTDGHAVATNVSASDATFTVTFAGTAYTIDNATLQTWDHTTGTEADLITFLGDNAVSAAGNKLSDVATITGDGTDLTVTDKYGVKGNAIAFSATGTVADVENLFGIKVDTTNDVVAGTDLDTFMTRLTDSSGKFVSDVVILDNNQQTYDFYNTSGTAIGVTFETVASINTVLNTNTDHNQTNKFDINVTLDLKDNGGTSLGTATINGDATAGTTAIAGFDIAYGAADTLVGGTSTFNITNSLSHVWEGPGSVSQAALESGNTAATTNLAGLNANTIVTITVDGRDFIINNTDLKNAAGGGKTIADLSSAIANADTIGDGNGAVLSDFATVSNDGTKITITSKLYGSAGTVSWNVTEGAGGDAATIATAFGFADGSSATGDGTAVSFSAGDTLNLYGGVTLTTSSTLANYAAGAETSTINIASDVGYIATLQDDLGVQVAGSSQVVVDSDGSYNLGNGVSILTGSGALSAGDATFSIESDTAYNAVLKKGASEIETLNGIDDGELSFQSGKLTVDLADKTTGAGNSATFTVTGAVEDKALRMQVGANQGQSFTVDIDDMQAKALMVSGGSGGDASSLTGVTNAFYTVSATATDGTNNTKIEFALDVSTDTGGVLAHQKASAAIKVINNAIERVSAERSKLGAFQNRLEHTINNLGTSSENLTAAESRVRDVDMAKEMMEFTKNNILAQAAQAMLAQANQQPQGVLQLLR